VFCPSVCQFVRPVRADNLNTKSRIKTRTGVNVSRNMSDRVSIQSLAQTVKGHAGGRTICRHWADVVLLQLYLQWGPVVRVALENGWFRKLPRPYVERISPPLRRGLCQ